MKRQGWVIIFVEVYLTLHPPPTPKTKPTYDRRHEPCTISKLHAGGPELMASSFQTSTAGLTVSSTARPLWFVNRSAPPGFPRSETLERHSATHFVPHSLYAPLLRVFCSPSPLSASRFSSLHSLIDPSHVRAVPLTVSPFLARHRKGCQVNSITPRQPECQAEWYHMGGAHPPITPKPPFNPPCACLLAHLVRPGCGRYPQCPRSPGRPQDAGILHTLRKGCPLQGGRSGLRPPQPVLF